MHTWIPSHSPPSRKPHFFKAAKSGLRCIGNLSTKFSNRDNSAAGKLWSWTGNFSNNLSSLSFSAYLAKLAIKANLAFSACYSANLAFSASFIALRSAAWFMEVFIISPCFCSAAFLASYKSLRTSAWFMETILISFCLYITTDYASYISLRTAAWFMEVLMSSFCFYYTADNASCMSLMTAA